MHALILASALHWDPQIRGFLILATGLMILPGSVYLLLATNTGAKLGFVLAAAGLSGWLFLLSTVWIIYGTGMKGSQPSWRIKEVVTGGLGAHTALPAIRDFPKGFTPVPTAAAAPAQSAADAYLIPPPPPAAGQAAATPKFPPPFTTTQDYAPVGAYTKGGENYLFRIGSYRVRMTIRHHQVFIKHQPHYFVIQVQKALPAITLAGQATTLPAPDATAPIISVVMVRDVGSLRGPNMLIALSSFLIFAVCTSFLHRRDKEIVRLRASSPVTA
jgi:hypothetical protein